MTEADYVSGACRVCGRVDDHAPHCSAGKPAPIFDHLKIATSGTVKRGDKCVVCGRPRLYRVDVTRDDRTVLESLCGNSRCAAFLVEISE